jgi:hypothetical protein
MGAAARVVHAPADRGRAASFEAIQHDDRGPALSGVEGGGDPCRAKAYNDQVRDIVPLGALHIIDYEWRQVAHLDAGS